MLGALEAQKEMYEKKLLELQTQLQAPSPTNRHRVEPRYVEEARREGERERERG